MEALTPGHLVVVLIGFILLIGYKKLPDAARSVGRSLRIFRSEMRSLDGEPSGPAPVPPPVDAAPEAASVSELEREAAAAEVAAAQLRARASATKGRQHSS